MHNYCFKANITDRTTTIGITCFCPEADKLTEECNTVVARLEDKNPQKLPESLGTLKGITRFFQIYFTKESEPGRVSFILDKVFNPQPQAILPPDTSASETVETTVLPQKTEQTERIQPTPVETSLLTQKTEPAEPMQSTPVTEHELKQEAKEPETSTSPKKTAK